MRRFPLALVAASFVMAFSSSVFAVEVGVAWFSKSGMSERVLEGLQEGLATAGAEINLEIRRDLAGPDELGAVLTAWESEKQGVVVMRSSGAKWLAGHPLAIPAFIGAANHPTQLGVIQNLDAPEGNVTGVTYALPKADQFEIFQVIVPDINSVCLLLEEGHPSAPVEMKDTQEVCANLGVAFQSSVCTSLDQVLNTVAAQKGQVSAFIIGSQALIMDNAAAIVTAAGTTPVLSYSAKPVKAGALGGFVADDHKLGKLLAESLIAVLVDGQPVSSVPVKFDREPKFTVNVSTAEFLGLDIPYGLLQAATAVEGGALAR